MGARGFSAALINSITSIGVTGYSLIRTFQGESASSIADTIAAAAGTTPDSPTPFTPNGFNGEGDSTCAISMVGTSVTVGS